MHQTAQQTDHQHDSHTGHEQHDHAHHVDQFRRLFWVMVVLGIPVVVFNPMFADLLGYSLPDSTWVWWISPILGSIIYFWGGQPFLRGAVPALRGRQPGMRPLIGAAIRVACVASCGATRGFLDRERDFWWGLELLVIIMLLGHWLEMRSPAQTTSALVSLAALLPAEAEKL